MQIDPAQECTDYTVGPDWKRAAKLIEIEKITYLVLYFDFGHETVYLPLITLDATPRPTECIGYQGNVYYYRLGKIPHTQQIGTIIFWSDTTDGFPGTQFRLSRKLDSDCVIIEHKSRAGKFTEPRGPGDQSQKPARKKETRP